MRARVVRARPPPRSGRRTARGAPRRAPGPRSTPRPDRPSNERAQVLGDARLADAEARDELGQPRVGDAPARPARRRSGRSPLVPLDASRRCPGSARSSRTRSATVASGACCAPRPTDGVLTVTLARPERRNAIDGELAAALRDAFEAAADDAAVRALILTGEGNAFSRRRRPLALRARLGPARVPPRLAPADVADHAARAPGEADRGRDQRRRHRRGHAARARLRRAAGGASARASSTARAGSGSSPATAASRAS